MNCPKCGSDQPDTAVECGTCGVIIAKALKARQQPAAMPSPPSSAPPPADGVADARAEEGTHAAPLYLVVPLLIAILAAAWWLNFPLSGELTPNAYVNLKHQFALSAPPDWLQLTPENFKQLAAQYADRLPKQFAQVSANPGFEVGFVKLSDNQTDFAPSLNIVVMPFKKNLPTLTESERNLASESIVAEIKKRIAGYTVETTSIVTVDGLASLQIVGSAPMTLVLKPSEAIMSEPGAFGLIHAIGQTEAVTKTFTLKTNQILVPGKKRGYVITYTGDADTFDEVVPLFNGVTTSFRVIERPPRFGPIVMGALNGGLIGGGIYALYILIGKLFLLFAGKATSASS